MPKINYRALLFLPEARTFTELAAEQVGNRDHTDNKDRDDYRDMEGFDASDNGKAAAQMLSDMQADALMLDLLFKFNDRQKIILLYQVLREAGYNLNHEDCAKTLSLTREHYMFLLKGVKTKARKVLQDAGI